MEEIERSPKARGRCEEGGGEREEEEGFGEAVCRGEGHIYGSDGWACVSPFSPPYTHIVNFY